VTIDDALHLTGWEWISLRQTRIPLLTNPLLYRSAEQYTIVVSILAERRSRSQMATGMG
jgi:hypothetical protein